MGLPAQHNLTFAFAVAGPSAAVGGAPAPETATFLVGLREITGLNDANNNLVVRVNGQRILIRGGGWGPDLLQRNTPQRNARQLLLTRDLGLNAIRLEGKLQDDDLFAQASAMGILMLPGICCCDAWQQWDLWTNATAATASQSMASQLKRLRMHASVASFIYSSDELPPPHVEQMYLDVFAEERWAVGKVSSASDRTSTLTGHSGVKMAGPYGWVAPNYWYTDTSTRDVGSAYGFATEISPGAAPLTLDSLVKTIPASALWDPGSADGGPTADWNYHCGAKTGAFGSLKHFTPSITARYSAGASAADYLRKAQLASYESHRAMFEGYSRNKYNSTGLIQWMLNSAWPSNMWHLFDFYLQIGGSGFGAKKANAQPLHLLYSYDRPNVPSPPPGAVHDMVQVPHTDTVEDQYRTDAAASAEACCSECLADGAKCTHAVFSAGRCYLKNMKANDGGNSMTPEAAAANEDCTLCLKRELRSDSARSASTESVVGGTVAVVNSRYVADGAGLTAAATQYDLGGRVLHTQTLVLKAGIPADGTQNLFRLALALVPRDNRTSGGTVLLRLRFVERDDTDNWYWIPAAPDRFNMAGGCFTGCAVDSFADMKDLAAMPRSPKVTVTLGPAALLGLPGGRVRRQVTVSAAAASGGGGGLAFFVRLRALDAAGEDVLPATWSDNFITVLAGDTATVMLEHEVDRTVHSVTAAAFNQS